MSALAGKSILVTGAGRGLGAAISERLAQDGARVILADVREDWGQATTAALRERGADVRFIAVDVSDPDSVQRMADEAGPLYGLVNNAALADNVGGKNFWDIDVEVWDRLMSINLRGPWLVARAVAPAMIAAGEGRVINIASDAAIYGSPRLSHYITSKAGVMGLTRAMSRELGAHGITVNTVAPGITEVEATKDVPAERHELYRMNRAIQRPQQPADLVGAVAFLCGPEAAYITGQALVVNGGFILH